MTITTKAIVAALLMTLAPALASAQGYTNFGPGVGGAAPINANPGVVTPVLGQDCGASHFQYLVGLHPSIFPLPAHAEVVHPGTIRATIYIETRLNVGIGQNGYVERVYCG